MPKKNICGSCGKKIKNTKKNYIHYGNLCALCIIRISNKARWVEQYELKEKTKILINTKKKLNLPTNNLERILNIKNERMKEWENVLMKKYGIDIKKEYQPKIKVTKYARMFEKAERDIIKGHKEILKKYKLCIKN